MAAFNKFNAWVATVNNGGVNMSSDTIKVMLTNTAPVATNSLYADISGTELASGNGYATGGVAVTSQSSTQTGGVYTFTGTLANPTWTATGSMGPFRYSVFYDSTAAGIALHPLIAWYDYGSSTTLSSGQTFNVSIASGLFTDQ